MKRLFQVIFFITLAGFVGIQFATLIDDPQHLVEPDPDCPICLAAETQVCIDPPISFSFTPAILLYLAEKEPLDQELNNYSLILSIRAPPLS